MKKEVDCITCGQRAVRKPFFVTAAAVDSLKADLAEWEGHPVKAGMDSTAKPGTILDFIVSLMEDVGAFESRKHPAGTKATKAVEFTADLVRFIRMRPETILIKRGREDALAGDIVVMRTEPLPSVGICDDTGVFLASPGLPITRVEWETVNVPVVAVYRPTIEADA